MASSTSNDTSFTEHQSKDDSSDIEFHDAESDPRALEEKFADALDFNVNRDTELSEEELHANKEKSEALKSEGNAHFKNAEYTEAIDKYSEALEVCPHVHKSERAILFGNRAAAHKYLEHREEAINDCSQAIELNPDYLKAYARRAALYEETDKLDECFADYNKVIELDPNNNDAKASVTRLKPLIDERNERLKAEMMGKLKDLGNMILKPFGLSTNNFQLQQDPSTGSYSVNFNQGDNK